VADISDSYYGISGGMMVSRKGLDNRILPVAEKPISEFKKHFPNSCVSRFHGYRFNQIQGKSYIN